MPQPLPDSEREQTDESLRLERERADQAIEEDREEIDDTADAVIARARARADQLLAAARAKTDRQAAGDSREAEPPPVLLQRERVREDQVLRAERATADQTLREERAEHVALLTRERDETDKDLSTERARSDASLATRDNFLSMVSHDLRNMLNAIIGSAAVITQQLTPPPPRTRSRFLRVVRGITTTSTATDRDAPILVNAQRIQRAGARMDRLIGDLIDVAGIEAGVLAVTPELADPALVAAEAVEAFHLRAEASGVSLATEIVPPASQAVFDPARILQVLTNLLSNSFKFTPRGGRVVVRVERIAEDIAFAVTDTGVGIPTDSLEAVFVRFRQVTKNDRRGMGLGLYISKSIVQGHGGRIWAESPAGTPGCRVCFTLPIAGP